jgi:hypothetical protein
MGVMAALDADDYLEELERDARAEASSDVAAADD